MSDIEPLAIKPEAIASGTETCGCCDGIEPSTPQAMDNRAGLAEIAYRIGRYGDFRASLQSGLSSLRFAPLGQLRTRDDDDFTIALIDAFACAADVLTFYQERIANESYLRSATERVSLQEMGRLIGYRLRPGVAAETWLAFALETPPTPPPNLAPEPGSFVHGVPATLRLDAGLKVQSVPGPGEKPQVFETLEAIDARPAWNAMRPWLAEARRPARGDTVAYAEGLRNNLKSGDALVFLGESYLAGSNADDWEFRVIDSVELQSGFDRTRISWRRPLSIVGTDAAANRHLLVMRKRASAFGHNAPAWRSMSSDFRADYVAAFGGSATQSDWPRFRLDGASGIGELIDIGLIEAPNQFAAFEGAITAASNAPPAAAPIRAQPLSAPLASAPGGIFGSLFRAEIEVASPFFPAPPQVVTPPAQAPVADGRIDLDTVYGEVTPGGHALLARGDFNFTQSTTPAGVEVQIFSVASVSEVSRAEFALSGKVTRLQLTGAGYGTFVGYVRDTAAFVQSERLALAPFPVTTAVSGEIIPVAASADGLVKGRRLIVRGRRVSNSATVVHQATLVEATAHANGAELRITPQLPAALARESVVVYGNVAAASHGETVAQILGAGDASRAHQRFELKQAPLTWRAAGTELGAASELTVRIDDIAWPVRDTLYGAAPTERAYALSIDEHGRQWVRFGDGLFGARLPSGSNNVRATYRKGIGVAGNVAAESLSQLVSRPLGLKSVANPSAALGGTDPESAGAARRTMPLATRTLGRAVSVLDYEDFARAFTGIAKAQAAVLALRAGPTVCITIAGPDNAPITSDNPVWDKLLDALKKSGDPLVRVQLLTHRRSTFRVGLKVKRDSDFERDKVLAALDAALRAHFAFDARDLGQPVQQSDVIAVAHTVPGVIAIDLDFLFGGSTPRVQTIPLSRQVRLLAQRMQAVRGNAVAAEVLTLDPGPLARLEEMS